MERLGTLPFVAQPGEAWVYGYNTDILGCVVERASGMPLDEFIRTRITGPLGMKDTQFFLPAGAARPARRGVCERQPTASIARAPEGARGQGHYVDGPRKSFAGGAGLLSTARDYARFLEMIRNGGALDGVRILSPRTVAADDHQPGRHAALDDRARLRPRLRDHRPLRRERAGLGGRVRLGRRLRHDLPRRSRSAAGDGADDPADAERHRHPARSSRRWSIRRWYGNDETRLQLAVRSVRRSSSLAGALASAQGRARTISKLLPQNVHWGYYDAPVAPVLRDGVRRYACGSRR